MFDLVTKYYYVFKEDYESFHLLSEIEKYINGIEIQVRRIQSFKNRMNKQMRNRNFNHNQLFLDCHFYFICLDKIDKFFDRLANRLKNENINKLKKEFKLSFDCTIRDDFEHLDERVIGQKFGRLFNDRQSWERDFLNYSFSSTGDFLSFGGKQFAIGKTELIKLRKIFRKLISIIHKDYALKNQDFVNRLVQEKRINFILKDMDKKLYLPKRN